jgi:hypothetical protein
MCRRRWSALLLLIALLLVAPPAAGEPTDPGEPGADARVAALKRDVTRLLQSLRATELKQGRALPWADAWPLNLGRERATQIVHAAVEGRGTQVVPQDQAVYCGGGVVIRPADAAQATITINWRVIRDELTAADAADRRLGELEQQATEILRRIRELRAATYAIPSTKRVMTPDEAVEAFNSVPAVPAPRATVEFGISDVGWPDGPIAVGADPLPPIVADWDSRLPGGAKFSLVLTARAIRGIDTTSPDAPPALVDQRRVDALCRQLKGRGVRATGTLKAARPGDRHTDYYLVVDNAKDF